MKQLTIYYMYYYIMSYCSSAFLLTDCTLHLQLQGQFGSRHLISVYMDSRIFGRNKHLPAEEDREREEGQFSQSGADTGKDHS